MGGITVHVPVKIELHPDYMAIDGVYIAYDVLPQLVAAITQPDPRRWYRFERVGDTVIVQVRISEEGANGQPIGTIGDRSSEENTGRQG